MSLDSPPETLCGDLTDSQPVCEPQAASNPEAPQGPPNGWTEHVEWEVLLPANAFRPEPVWEGVDICDFWRHEGCPLRSRRVWAEPWQQVEQ